MTDEEHSFWVTTIAENTKQMQKGYEDRIAVLEKACADNARIIAEIGRLLIQENRIWITSERD